MVFSGFKHEGYFAVKRILIFALLGGLLSIGSGCGLMQAIFCYRPCVMRGDCPPGPCDSFCGDDCGDCGPAWGMPRGRVAVPRRAVVSDDCGVVRGPICGPACGGYDPCMDPCGECCYGRCWHRGPLSCIFALFMRESWYGPSCGERYWGDFYSDPPDCWDPCDCYGNYSGGSQNVYSRQARRVDRYSGDYFDYGMPNGGGGEQIISENERVVAPAPRPTPAPKPRNAAR